MSVKPIITNTELEILIIGKQSNIFDFLNEDIEESKKDEVIINNLETNGNTKLSSLDYSDIPEVNLNVLLEEMQELIKKGIISQSDKYYRLWLGYRPNVVKSLANDSYNIMAIAWSDSAIYYDVFNNKDGINMTTENYLNTCSLMGAYTKAAWEFYNSDKQNITPSNIMERFKINEHIRAVIFGSGTKEDCERAANMLIEWNRNHIKDLKELHADKIYDFIRIHRRKGEIESTRCMNGECIGGILIRETAF